MRAILCVLLAVFAAPALAVEPVVGGPCEGCEAIFDLRGPAPVGTARLAPDGAAGQPMLLRGVVRGRDGLAVGGVIVYGYQTNAAGIYEPDEKAPSRAGRRHGRYRGWVQTDAEGRFELRTVRPGGYPASDLPAHIHLHVLEPGCATYYLEDVTFTDDARLTEAQRRAVANGRGGSGVTTPQRIAGVWHVQRHIRLGQGIEGYPDCGGK